MALRLFTLTLPSLNHGRERRFLRAGVAVLIGLLSPMLAGEAHASPAYRARILASGLANPRGLLVNDQRVLVSEAGSGAAAAPGTGPCITSGSRASICQGFTGAIGSWDPRRNTYVRLITGLPSLAQADGSEGTGIADLSWNSSLGLVGVFGLGGDPRQPNVDLLDPLFGHVVSIDLATGQLQPRSNLAAYERQTNPDGNSADFNSNPYAIQAFSNKLFVSDAGANTLLTIDPSSVDPSGNFPIVSHFVFPRINITNGPPFTTSSVPTGLTVISQNNSLNIGEFTGFPFEPRSASVFSLVDGVNTSPSQSLTGFSLITDLAAGDDGSLYVMEYATSYFRSINTGSIWRVAPNGSRRQIITGLSNPAGLAVGEGGVLYVANNADGLNGELLQFSPVPGPLPLLAAGAAWIRSRSLRWRLRQARGGQRR